MTKQRNSNHIPYRSITPSHRGSSIFLMQTAASRAVNTGYIKKRDLTETFIPGRMNLGTQREIHTALASSESLRIPEIAKLLAKFNPQQISTITLLREAVAYRVGNALYENGIAPYYGDVYIGVNHIKEKGTITTSYTYENTEGLVDGGLWIVADSICVGRNLTATLQSLFRKSIPAELLFLAPIVSRSGIETVDEMAVRHNIPATYIAWGALFGVDEKTRYDMPWGHPLTEVFDPRDRETFISMYGPKLCVGGDFGNAYFCPPKAQLLYEQQLKEHGITPNIPSVSDIRTRYAKNEILTEDDAPVR